ncbi:MAG: hypothetical protein HY665_05170, partial [Chloroflexi bacterium]|nr:hypothetical protein [Chloroflexota bacterium]
MYEIRKVTPDEPAACIPSACTPGASACSPVTGMTLCNPATQVMCLPSKITCLPSQVQFCVPNITLANRNVSGTYKSPAPTFGSFLELRVDVDGRRPQNRVSGDVFFRYSFWGYTATLYLYSFVVNNCTIVDGAGEKVITGPVVYYNDPANINDTIEVRIPRVALFSSPADATAKFYDAGLLSNTFLCPKISEYFRTVCLEIDRFQGTTFPPSANTNTDPFPADLASETLTCAEVFRRSGIDMGATQDDVLNDPDSGDVGTNWDEGELHDLMEDRYDSFADTLQWNLYGVVVPRFGDPNYNSGYYGVMFDWGGYQAGDTYLRQGVAVAYDAIQGRVSGTLYNTAAKKDRLFLETFIHEVGHAFNLPHSWQRSANADSASESYMNYAWGYTGGGGESGFWSNFRWEFDDVELIWMRHADRKDVIFGGRDWIGNNLSIFMAPEKELRNAPLSLEVRAWDVFDFGQPVRVEIKLKNVCGSPMQVDARLQPEDGLVVLYVQQPNGNIVRYIPPVKKMKSPVKVELGAGKSIYESALLSFGAKGFQFQEPGEYIIRAYYSLGSEGVVISRSCRIRVAAPSSRDSDELAHLLFSHDVAKFLYFGGTERYPGLVSKLEEAAQKYAKSDPSVTRNIQAALGQYHSRRFKKVVTKENKRMITFRDDNLKEAISNLEAARQMLPVKRYSALDHITYNRASMLLADCYLKQDNKAEAQRTLQESVRYLERRQVVKPVLDDY